jgi:ADP-ribosylglycohydrolase
MTINQALLSLSGLSVGDAFGECFFHYPREMIANRTVPPGKWHWTDDTHMALSIVEVLREFGYIHQDALAQAFTHRFAEDPQRGYGGGAINLLRRLSKGDDWRAVAPTLFQEGSYGNGGAMRAAPIGGYYASDPARASHEGCRSAEITHSHPEGQAGAMAVAAAAAIAAQPACPTGPTFLEAVLPFVPPSLVHAGIVQALDIPPDDHNKAVQQLGTGARISAQDTVPYCLWCVAYNMNDYEAALWVTVSGLGDRDTTCAIVGGIVALSAGQVPLEWVLKREPLPDGF